MKTCLIDIISCAFMNNLPISTSAVDVITFGVVLHTMCIVPFSSGVLPFDFLGRPDLP